MNRLVSRYAVTLRCRQNAPFTRLIRFSTFRFASNRDPIRPVHQSLIFSRQRKYQSTAKEESSENLLLQDLKPAVDSVKLIPANAQQRLSLIEACLRTGQYARAWHLYQQLQLNFDDFRTWMTSDICASLLRALWSPGNSQTLNSLHFKEQAQQGMKFLLEMKRQNLLNIHGYQWTIKGLIDLGRQSPEELKTAERWIPIVLQDVGKCTNWNYTDVRSWIETDHLFTDEEKLILLTHLDAIKVRFGTQLDTETRKTTIHAPVLKDTGILASPSTLLPFIQKTLEPLQSSTNASENEDLQNLYQLQLDLERQVFSVHRDMLELKNEKTKERTSSGFIAPCVLRMGRQWSEQVTQLVQRDLENWSSCSSDDADISPYLLFFRKDPSILSTAAMTQLLKSFSLIDSTDLSNGGVPAYSLVDKIGQAVEYEYALLSMKDAGVRQKMRREYEALVKFRSRPDLLRKIKWDQNGLERWDPAIKKRIGSYLCSLILESAKIPSNINLIVRKQRGLQSLAGTLDKVDDLQEEQRFAFRHAYRIYRGKKLGIITMNQFLVPLLTPANVDGHQFDTKSSILSSGSLHASPKVLPMVVPPKPWMTYKNGGYLTIPHSIMRFSSHLAEAEIHLEKAQSSGRLEPILRGLDALGSTRWKVNEPLLSVMIEAWNRGLGKRYGLPEIVPEEFKPISFEEYQKKNHELLCNHDELLQRKIYNRAVREQRQNYYDQKSIRITENYKLEIAKAFVGRTLYFPQNLDFRGRAYPIPPHFNHLGNDLARSLLVFADKKPLGKEGLQWLKIHLANVYGRDKLTFSERVQFVDESLPKVRASASDPFRENWWLDAEKPWLCLATCLELDEAMKLENPEEYQCGMPVHQDGSCNGLQHYAALGGDRDGATQVNLVPGFDRPQDVYGAVAELVKERIKKDLQLDSDVSEFDLKKTSVKPSSLDDNSLMRKFCANLIQPDRIERKTVKQTVMTSVYGVTFVGARDQIRNRISEKYSHLFTEPEIHAISVYLAYNTLGALDQMFASARKIQDWLAATARDIARSVPRDDVEKFQQIKETLKARSGTQKAKREVLKKKEESCPLNHSSAVIWTTPLGLTVIQPYKKRKNTVISTALQDFTINNPFAKAAVDIQKQKAGFPPNFIHSLDATHMLMTALACSYPTTDKITDHIWSHDNGQEEKKAFEPIVFASVHDSYWTHATDVPRLRQILKEQFVKLHTQPVMENLRRELLERYKDRLVLNVYSQEEFQKRRTANQIPANGDLDDLENHQTDEPSENIEIDTENFDESCEDTKKKPKKSKKLTKIVRVWEPLVIAPVPAKGDFDVHCVKDSDYFFS